jgi:hypothetical protein
MRGQAVGRLPLLFIASFVALATLAAPAWSQAPLDRQSLVGEWSGSWKNKSLQQINGKYYLTIENVEGDKVYGQLEISGQQTVKLRQLGTLDGNRLTFSRPNPTEFLIEGNQMKGSSQGSPRGNPWDINLMKTK